MKNVLITGESGFFGSEIVRQLYKTGEQNITVLDSMTEQTYGKDWKTFYLQQQIEDKCHFVKGSVTDIDTILSLVKDSEYIIHLAAETGPGQSMYQINQYNETNVMGTSNILQAISTLGNVKLFFLHLVQFMGKENMNAKTVEWYIQIAEKEKIF